MEDHIMSSQQFQPRKWIWIFAGIVMGLIIAAGFEWTHISNAQSIASNVNPAQNNSTTVNPADLAVAEQLSNVFASVAANVNPSVVTVFTETNVKVQSQNSPFGQFFGNDDFFKRFFQMPEQQGNLKQQGLGSGVIMGSNGLILTNNHVVEGADNIKVSLMDGREFAAKVKGRDPQTDLAVLTIDAKNLQPIKIGNSDNMRVGDWVLAIGSPLDPELEHTVTSGIISAKGRSAMGLSQYEDYIQTDAAINPGNSGGALVNIKGELIGINSAIATQTGGFMGIGFAIPVNLAQKVMTDIVEKGKVVRGWLGVYIQNVTPEIAKAMNLKTPKGVIVSKVQDNSPAAKAGLKTGDVILAYNGKTLNNSVELSTWVAGTSPGTEISLKILRNGEEKTLNVKLEELNPEVQQTMSGATTYSDVGFKVSSITPELAQKYQISGKEHGVVVTDMDPNGIGAQSGIQEGDIIIKVNQKDILSLDDFNKEMKVIKPGDNVLFYLVRGNANLFVAFTMPGNQ